jgi:peptide/nickel transport system substrate-binding protein
MHTLRFASRRARAAATTVAAAALLTGAAACGNAATSTPSGSGSGSGAAAPTTLTTAWPADVDTLDPAAVSTDQDKELTMNLYQRLLEYTFAKQANGDYVWDGLQASPSLAQSYTKGKDSVTFKLRSDVKFYPTGNPLTATDVKYSFERALAENGTADLNNGGLFKASQIVVNDAHTVTFNFTDAKGTPAPVSDTLIATFRMPNFGIVDSVEVKKHVTSSDPWGEKWLSSHDAGTGPYYVAARSPGEQMTLQAVPKLWSGVPAYKTVNVRVVNNGSIASLLRGGSVNEALFGLTQNDLNSLGKSGFNVDHQTTPDFTYLLLPEGDAKSPFNNQDVRQAVAYAVPYQQIVQSVYFGRAQRSLSYVNLKAPGYATAWGMYDTDMAKAKALMAQAGNPKISVSMIYSNSEPSYADSALLIQSQLRQIGINLTLKPQTPTQMFSGIIARATAKTAAAADPSTPPIAFFNLSIYLDDPKSPVSFYSHSGAALNYGRWSSPQLDAMQDQNQFAPLSAQRAATYQQIQKMAATDASFIPLAITGRTVVTAPGITGISYSPEIGVRFWLLAPKSSAS